MLQGVLRGSVSVGIRLVDDLDTTSFWAMRETVYVLPGSHTCKVRLWAGGWEALGVSFVCKKGRAKLCINGNEWAARLRFEVSC